MSGRTSEFYLNSNDFKDYKRSYGTNGKELCYLFYKEYGFLHSLNDLPSLISFDSDGTVEFEQYHNNGIIHRTDNKPASIIYCHDGTIECRYFDNGKEYFPAEREN
jgi:hypothetical protein